MTYSANTLIWVQVACVKYFGPSLCVSECVSGVVGVVRLCGVRSLFAPIPAVSVFCLVLFCSEWSGAELSACIRQCLLCASV